MQSAQRNAPATSGFTLVELLVVITIITVLLAMLTPAMDQAMEVAMKAKCGANLHTFGVANGQYGIDNRGKLMTIPRHSKNSGQVGGDGLAYPWYIWVYQNESPPEFNIEAIRPYLGESQFTPVRGVWRCPSSQMDSLRAYNDMAIAQPRGPAPPTMDDFWAIWAEYSYFGGGGEPMPLPYVTSPQLLSTSRLGSGGTLMADVVFRHNNNSMQYNHGEYQRVPGTDGPPITGFNRLTGDGAAAWQNFTSIRAKALWNVGPGDAMGEYVSARGLANQANPAIDDLFTVY